MADRDGNMEQQWWKEHLSTTLRDNFNILAQREIL